LKLRSTINTLTDLSFSVIPYLLVFRLSFHPQVYSEFVNALILPAFAYAISDAGFSLLTPVFVGRASVVLPQTRLKLVALIQALLYLICFIFLLILQLLFFKESPISPWWLYLCFLLYLVPVLLSGWYLNYIFSSIAGPIFILFTRIVAAVYIALSPTLPSVRLQILVLALLLPGIFLFFIVLHDFCHKLSIYQRALHELIPLFSLYSSLRSIAFGVYSFFPILISARSPELVPLFIYLDKTKSLYAIPFSFFGQISYWAHSQFRSARYFSIHLLFLANFSLGALTITSIPFIFGFLPRYIAQSIDYFQFGLFILSAIFSVCNSLLLFKGFLEVHPAKLSFGLSVQSIFFLIAYLCYQPNFTWVSSVVCLSELILFAVSALVIKTVQSHPVQNSFG
jgi:hypothetical protein